jgi:hypothetical protein
MPFLGGVQLSLWPRRLSLSAGKAQSAGQGIATARRRSAQAHGAVAWAFPVRDRRVFDHGSAITMRLTAACIILIMTGPIFAPVTARADWRSWLFGPKDYEECAENAAREAKSREALHILLSSCELKFRGRRKSTGGYMLYDDRQNRSFDIKGPNPTPAELEYIEKEYSGYIEAKADFDKKRREYEREEAERRREEAARQAASRLAEAERQRVAKAEFQQRQRTASLNLQVTSASVDCSRISSMASSCVVYKLTVGIRNRSVERLSALSLGWAFMPNNESKCPSSLPTKRRLEVKLGPDDTTTLNIDGHDGPDSAQFRYCVMVTGAEIVP